MYKCPHPASYPSLYLAMSSSVYVLAIAAAVAFVYLVRLRSRNPKGLPVPPGPRGLPFIGAIYDVPQDVAWRTFQDWSKKYGKSLSLCFLPIYQPAHAYTLLGDLIYFQTFGKDIVVINSASIAHDLLEKRSALYSCRPWVPMAGDVYVALRRLSR